ncbi:MAG TPA: hypothetical protein VD908_01940 [Cytophagales bacterium]|nr:hypothetical protein [Cytophagales bacterium]
MKRSLLLLILFFINFLCFSQITNFHPYQTIVYKLHGTIPMKDQGYYHYLVDFSAPNQTFLTVNFYNLKEETNSYKIPLPKLEFLGYANNDKETLFLFYDFSNRVLNYVIFHDRGKRVSYKRKKIRKALKNSTIFYADAVGFYTSKKMNGDFTITKVSYKTDTLWTKVFTEKKTNFFLHNALSYNNKLYLNIHANRILCLNDKSGNIIYDRDINDYPRIKQNFKFLLDEETEELILAGEEFDKLKAAHANGIFLMKLSSTGETVFNHYFPMPKITFKSIKSKEGVFIRDVVKVDTGYALVAESINKTTGNAVAGYIIGGAVMALTGVLVAPNTAVAYVTGLDISLLKPTQDNKNLAVITLDKGPVEKYYPQDVPAGFHVFHGILNLLHAFDYQFSLTNPDGNTNLVYFHSLSKEGITIAKATFSNNIISNVKKYLVRANMNEVISFKMLKLSNESVLLELQTDKHLFFKVLSLSSFEEQ